MDVLGLGFIIFLAFWTLWIKLNIVTRLKALGHPFALDMAVSGATFVLFGGTNTITGMLAASAAAVVMSINISVARHIFGYYKKVDGKWYYIVGKINQVDNIRRSCS